MANEIVLDGDKLLYMMSQKNAEIAALKAKNAELQRALRELNECEHFSCPQCMQLIDIVTKD